MADDQNLSGRYARVTGLIRPGADRFGEVMLDVRGGREAFYAQPYDGEETIAVGAEVVVVAHAAGLTRTLLVTAMPLPSTPADPS